MIRRLSVVAAATLLAAGCTCKPTPSTPTDQVHAPGAERPVKLAPLPAPPKLDVTPEAYAGAGKDLAVVAARPQGPMQGEVRPTVTFSRPVKTLEMVEDQRAADKATPFAKIDPPLEGEWRWLGSASAEFVPKGLVPYSTEYTVTVFQGLKALDGAELKAPYSFHFSTPALALQDVSPARGSRWMKPDDTISLLFNQPVKDAELAQAVRFVVEGEKAPFKAQVMARVSIQEEKRKAVEERKKAGKSYEPLSDDERGFKNQQTRYTLAPEKAFPKGRQVTLQFDTSLHGEQGPLPMQSFEAVSFRTYGPFTIDGAAFCGLQRSCSYGPLVLVTSNEAKLDTLKGKLQITPPVELDWDAADVFVPGNQWDMSRPPSVTIPGKFRPGTEYTISLAAGSADVFGKLDAKGLSTSLTTEDLSPSLTSGPFLAFLESTGEEPKLPIEVANLSALDVKMWKVTPAQLPEYLSGHAELEPHPVPDFAEKEALHYPRNVGRVHPLKLSKALGEGVKTGLVLVSVDAPELEYHPKGGYRQLVQLTDLAAHIKVGPKSSLAWVTRVSTGAPVADADVTVYAENGASLWTGKTNAEGFADIPGAVELKLASPRYQWEVPTCVVVAQKDGDVSGTANTWSSGVEAYEFGLTQGWEGEAPVNTGFVFTDRGIYRPGDTVHVKGVVRYRSLGELRAPAEGSTMLVKVTDSKDNELKKELVKISKYGTFELQVKTLKDGALGTYSVHAEGELPVGKAEASASFRVEEYRAPQFIVDVAAKKQLVSGDPVEAGVTARYLFGGAMADVKVKWSVNRHTTSFSPDSAPDYTFTQETWWWDDRQPEEASYFFGSGEAQADAQGHATVKAGTSDAPGGKPYSYTLEAEVTDANRQAVAGRAEFTVHPAAYYAGLRSTSSFMQVGSEYPIDVLVLDVDGKRAPGKAVEVQISSRTWKSVKKKSAGGGFETVSEPVETEAAKCALTSGDGAVPCKFKPVTAGFFVVKAKVKDEAGRVHQSSLGVYATGSDWVAWQRNDTDRVELVTDKPKYAVGDTAKVLIKSPYPEAKALVTTEREGVLSRRLVDLKGSVVAVDVPITEEHVPNVYVGVLIMRPRVAKGGIETGDDPGRPNARVGLVKLNVEEKTRRLAVTVKTQKDEFQPREKVEVDVDVKDSAGRPADGELTLYAVDLAVLRITSYEPPDPVKALYPERPLSMRLGEPLLHLVRRRNYGEKGEPAGGGGGGKEGAGLRSNFKTTVLFQTLEVKGGKAHGSFALPDNLTTFRVMGVVVTNDGRGGTGTHDLRVSKPVMALPAMPRFARVNDHFEAGVVVHSHGGGAGEVTVSAKIEGGATLEGPAEQKVMVKEGAPKEVRFKFTATKPGVVAFRFTATNGPNTDAVEEKIPVELPVEVDAVAVSGDTSDQRVEGVSLPKDLWPDQGGLTVSMSSTSLGNFGEGFQQLVEYPYGCLEQQSSRLVPFVALREIAGQFGVPWPAPNAKKAEQSAQVTSLLRTFLFPAFDAAKEKNPDQVIASTVRSISALQREDGSFRYWPTSWCSNSWASAYATMSLWRAHEVGFEVPKEVLSKAQGYLSNVVGGKCSPCELSCDDETRAFASYVLARTKRPKPSTYGELYVRRENLSLFGRALLANAMFVGGGNRAQANALLQEILNNAKESPKGVHIEETHNDTYFTYFQSDTRTTGVVLQALTDIQPDHPYVGKMAQYLTGVRQGNGEWRSTQEAAFSLMALTEVVRTKEKDAPDFKAQVALGDASLAEETFQGRSLDVKTKPVPMSELLAKAGGEKKQLTFKKDGAGVLYYSATLRYAPKELPTKSLDNGLFVQRWYEPWTGGGQTTSFTAGELVRVRLRVATNQERSWAAFEVPLPAGLEPVDVTLATTASNAQAPGEGSRGVDTELEGVEDAEGGSAEGPGGFAWGFWSPFTYTEMHDDKVVVFSDHLPPGVHVVSFVARATTPGSYVNRPARGSLMYEPEVWGRSEGGMVEVTLPTPVTQR